MITHSEMHCENLHLQKNHFEYQLIINAFLIYIS